MNRYEATTVLGLKSKKCWTKLLLGETSGKNGSISDSKFGWTKGKKINLERALKVGDELGGHIVTGHIDGTGIIKIGRASCRERV